MRPLVDFQHVLHGGDKGRAGLGRDHPLPLEMGLEKVFFESPSDRVIAGALDDPQFDDFFLQQI